MIQLKPLEMSQIPVYIDCEAKDPKRRFWLLFSGRWERAPVLDIAATEGMSGESWAEFVWGFGPPRGANVGG